MFYLFFPSKNNFPSSSSDFDLNLVNLLTWRALQQKLCHREIWNVDHMKGVLFYSAGKGKGKGKRGFVSRLVLITPVRCSGMAHILKGSHSFTCTPRVPLTEWTIPAFTYPAEAGTHLSTRKDGRLSWPWVAGWLHTEMSVRHRELNPDTVAHLSTNRARRRLTSLIEAFEANALTTTPGYQTRIR